jgi:hypothetical protein
MTPSYDCFDNSSDQNATCGRRCQNAKKEKGIVATQTHGILPLVIRNILEVTVKEPPRERVARRTHGVGEVRDVSELCAQGTGLAREL